MRYIKYRAGSVGGQGASESVGAPVEGKLGKPKRMHDSWSQCLWLPAHEDGPRRGDILPGVAEQQSEPVCDHGAIPKSWSLNLHPALRPH